MARHHHRPHPDDIYCGSASVEARRAPVREHARRLALLVGLTALFLLVALVVSSRADGVDPHSILEQHADALGGMDRLTARESVRMKGTLTVAGLTGTVETWQGSGRMQRQEVDLVVFAETSGDDGVTVWQRDANGKVQIVQDENALVRREVEARIAGYEPFDRNSDVFSAEYVGQGDVDGAACYIIRITNSLNDDVFETSIDVGTLMERRRRTTTPDVVSTTHFSDFRDVGGVTYPFSQETLIEPPGQTQTFTVTEIEVAPVFDPALFAPPTDDVRDFRFASGGPFEIVPMRFHENHIYVVVEMEGSTGLWILDSGASATCIDERFANELGLEMVGEMEGIGAGSTVTVSFVELPGYRVGGIEFASQKCVSLDIAPLFEKTSDLDISGILGYDFLSRFVTRVDYAREELTFYDPEYFEYAGDGTRVDASLVGDTFTVPVSVDGESAGRWTVDLGASGESFHYPFAAERGYLEREGIDRVGFGAGGRMARQADLFGSIEVGGFVIEHPVISIPKGDLVGAFGSTEISGNLGNSLFRRFVLYLDYARQEVIFERGEDFEKHVPLDRSGLQIWWGEPGVVEVLHVAAGTPADAAGLADGDVIASINGIPAEYFAGLSAIRELLRRDPGTLYEFEVIRGGQTEQITVELAKLLE